MNKFRILVFPCGSEIGLEINRSLKFSNHIELIGANSKDDHGKFVYENYVGDVPFVDSENLISFIKQLVLDKKIDAIYPAMDKLIWKLKINEKEIGCKVISSPVETTEICISKYLTYNKLRHKIKVPLVYNNLERIKEFPVFIKPDVGYGTRGVYKANNFRELQVYFENRDFSEYVITEYLPNEEFTVDCFTDRYGLLRFCGPRTRSRIMNGISVNTKPVKDNFENFLGLAQIINRSLNFRGAWFFQVKKDKDGILTLLEIAPRLGGSSSLNRGLGVNFALLSIFDAFDLDVDILTNDYSIELDRALNNKYNINLEFSTIYIDFDDCLIINNKVNTQLISFLFECLNEGKRLILITKHDKCLIDTLIRFRLNNLFDRIINIDKDEKKSSYIIDKDCIYVDDSFRERKEVKESLNIPVFSPDMIETLLP